MRKTLGKGGGYVGCRSKCNKLHSRLFVMGNGGAINTLLKRRDRFVGIAYYKKAVDLYYVIIEFIPHRRPRHDHKMFNGCECYPLLGMGSYIGRNFFLQKEFQNFTHVYGFDYLKKCFNPLCHYFKDVDTFTFLDDNFGYCKKCSVEFPFSGDAFCVCTCCEDYFCNDCVLIDKTATATCTVCISDNWVVGSKCGVRFLS